MNTQEIISMYNSFLNLKEPEKIEVLYDFFFGSKNKISKYPLSVSVAINDYDISIIADTLKSLKDVKNSLIESGLVLLDGDIIYEPDERKYLYIADYVGEERAICYN
jgi:hypothetical protein